MNAVEPSFVDHTSGAQQLRRLSADIHRIAQTLAGMSENKSDGDTASIEPAVAPPIEQVRDAINARRLRGRFWRSELFGEPAWDMLLDLYQAEISFLRVSVSSLAIAAAIPSTTALRWLKVMVKEGLVVRREDPTDGRRIFVELTPETSGKLAEYFRLVLAPVRTDALD